MTGEGAFAERGFVMNRFVTAGLSLAIAACGADPADRGRLGGAPATDGGAARATDDAGTSVPSGGFEGEIEAGTGPVGDPESCVATSAQAVKPPIDLVMTIDQSPSMNDDIANVKANINRLADLLRATKLDFRLVMIASHGAPIHTTAQFRDYEVCVPPPLGAARCGEQNAPFFRQINQNVQSTDTLKIILQTHGAADPKLAWKDALRKDALKVFVPVTDDDAQDTVKSLGAKCSEKDYADPERHSCYPGAVAFDKALLALPGGQFGSAASRNYVFYPIVGAAAFPSEVACGANAINNGQAYLELAKLTKGRWFPICLSSFAPVFDQIAKDVAARVACELAIPEAPAGTIDHEKVNVSWTPSSGGRRPILQDASKACEGGADGWQYDDEKTKVRLCGKACADVRADPGARVDVEFGCRTKIR
jgi:hypothetical protein